MNKGLLLICGSLVFIAFVLFNSKFYYPALPIHSISKKEALEALKTTSTKVIKIGEENEDEWFIARMEQGEAYEHIKTMVIENEWQFVTQEGSGFFFEKENERLIVTTQMWTKDYVLAKIPKKWND